MDALALRQLDVGLLDVVYEIESQSYPEDEKATREKLQMRLEKAGPYFWGAYDGDELVGYVCGTLACGDELRHESMSRHDPSGETLCVHSVVVHPDHRRKRIGVRMMQQYVDKMRQMPNVKLGLLLCKAELRGFYEQSGWEYVRVSPVVHGQDEWHEMRQSLE